MRLLQTGVSTGLNDAMRSLQYSRQTGQVRQQRGHEDQTSMFSNDFSTQHARHAEAQRSLAVQIKRFSLPPLQVQSHDPEGVPVDLTRDQHDKGTRQLCPDNTPQKAHL